MISHTQIERIVFLLWLAIMLILLYRWVLNGLLNFELVLLVITNLAALNGIKEFLLKETMTLPGYFLKYSKQNLILRVPFFVFFIWLFSLTLVHLITVKALS